MTDPDSLSTSQSPSQRLLAEAVRLPLEQAVTLYLGSDWRIGSFTDTEVIVFATAVAVPLFTGISAAIDEPRHKDCSNE